ncbi:MAG: LON peptidase substrate-binding domain-containing protein [Polyangiales bacterium]
MTAPLPSLDDDQRASLAAVPVFPLPNVVLLPGMRLPLHIFEPRYRQLTRDALAGPRTLVVTQLAASPRGASMSDDAQPPIVTVAGVGVIVHDVALPDGRFNLIVEGRARVRLHELAFVPPYRRARAELLDDDARAVSSLDLQALHSAATTFLSAVRRRETTFALEMPSDLAPGALADWCAWRLLVDPDDRQAALEALDPARRVHDVAAAIAGQMTLFRANADAPS